jgi:putative Mg2+ transporter-C (MgtC) family protein
MTKAVARREAAVGGWWQSVVSAFGGEAAALGDGGEVVLSVLRLLLASAAGFVVGWQRERSGKQAGPRTHMLVALGAALMMLAARQGGMAVDQLSRVMQGVAEGVGFIGGGVILKLTKKQEVRGLTTAAGLWTTAALGLAAGLGRYLLVFIGVTLAWFVLSVVRRWEEAEGEKKPSGPSGPPPGPAPEQPTIHV